MVVSQAPSAREPRFFRSLLWLLLVAFLCFGARVDAAVQFLRGWGNDPGPGQLGGPYGIAVAPDGYLYVTDQHLYRVVKFTRDGQFVTAWGSQGSGPGQFGLPIGIAVDSLNRVLVVDLGNHRVSMFTNDGGFVRQWGSEGGGPGQFGSYMRRLLISPDGNVVVPNGNQVSVFDSMGAYQYAWGQGSIGEPSAIALDGQGNYYVLSEGNYVSEWTQDHQKIRGWGTAGQGPGELNGPTGIAVSSDSRVYVVSHLNHRADVFLPGGQYVESFGSYGMDPGEFNTPADVTIDNMGLIYVIDLGGNRVQVFDPGIGVGDLAVTTPSGWVAPVVPRPLGDATETSVPGPLELIGGSPATYLNWAAVSSVAPPTSWGYEIRVDGEPLLADAAQGSGTVKSVNAGPFDVPGGWHTLDGIVDPSGSVTELYETNNRFTSQWLWKPKTVGRHSSAIHNAPPLAGSGARPNCDAVELQRDLRYGWIVTAAANASTDAYNLVCFDDYTDAQHGLQNVVHRTMASTGKPAFVVGSFRDDRGVIYPAVTDQLGAGLRGGYRLCVSDAQDRQSDSSAASWSGQLGQGELAQVYEGYLAAGVPYHMELAQHSGAGDIEFEVFGPTGGLVHSNGEGVGSVSVAGTPVDSMLYVPTVSGWHQVAVFRSASASDEEISYGFAWRADENIVGVGLEGLTIRRFEGPSPNPVRQDCSFTISLPNPEKVSLEAYDLNGRFRALIWSGTIPSGRTAIPWDVSRQGQPALGAGVFWVRLRGAGWESRRRVVVIR